MTQIKVTFDPSIAKEFGTDSAIILSNIEFWQSTNEANKINFYDGVYWTYNSVEAFNTSFNYLTYAQIRRCLDKLIDAGILIVGNYNNSAYDRTKWYSSIRLKKEDKTIYKNKEIHLSELTNEIVEINEPIPYSKPNVKPNKKENIQKIENPFKNWSLEDFVKSITDENKTSLPKSELKQFYDYWREKDPKGKFKFQNQKSWETGLRLNNWERNYKKFNSQQTSQETSLRSKAL